MALEDKSAVEGYLETMMQGTTLRQKAYASESLTLASTAGCASKQTNESEHERTRGARTHE